MTSLEQLNGYLRRLEWRLRLFAASRGFAVTAGCALLLTLLFVYIGNRFEFTGRVILPLRVALYLLVGSIISAALVRPLLQLNRRRVTRQIEERAPEFNERLLTIAERGDQGGAWMELLAEDTLSIAQRHAPEEIRSRRALLAFSVAASVAAVVLVWLIAAGPGYWGYGASLLWTGKADVNKRPLYSIEVQPGNKTIRRKSNQPVTAELLGFSAPEVVLHARYGNASKWDSVRMEPAKGGGTYRFVFAGVQEPVEYFVEASHSQSKHFVLAVKDLPGVQRIRVALRYPTELGLENVTLDPAGDIRAVTGTEAEIHVKTDRPLERGVLVLDRGKLIPLTAESGNWYSAHIRVQKDGSYYVAAIDAGETIRISEDYFIEAQKDESPTVKISRPGHDPHVSPIEEMPVTVTASDDFGMGAVELHYAVNGGPEQTISMLKAKGSKDAEGKTTIAFEDLKAAPGDMVALYATARDAHSTARSDMVFAQADAFDYKFSQSQQMGGQMGGGGGGNESSEISERQKQIIAATFNQLKAGKTGAARNEDAKFLSGEQAKLGEQARTLARRMESRELGASGQHFEQFAKLLTQASIDMDAAAEQLRPAKWNDALPPEQKALASLLRAEALFRDIMVSMGQQGGGNGGNNNAGRDLARMFDLELDTSKNQYETGRSAAPELNDQQKALDEARRRLEELARRQQELAAQNMKQQAFEQRWQEEQLRREAEELRRQLQEMAQNNSGQQQQSESQQGQQQGRQQEGQQGQQQQQGQQGQMQAGGQQMAQSNSWSPSGQRQSGSQRLGSRPTAQEQQMKETVQQAMRALQRAEEEMRKSVSNHDQTAGARAAEQLRQAQDLMQQALQKQAGGTVTDLASRAEQIARTQRDLAERMKQMYGSDGRDRLRNYAGMDGGRQSDNPNAMPEMNDPNMRTPFGMRRRLGLGVSPLQPLRQPTAAEKGIAEEKEKLAAQIESLQRQMQQQAQGMSGARPDASAKLLRALSDAESKELALRLQKNAEWMRQGFGDRNLGMEDAVTAGLLQLGRDLRDVQVALNSPDPNGEVKQQGRDLAAGTRTPNREDSPAQYRDAVAGYFKKLSQAKQQ